MSNLIDRKTPDKIVLLPLDNDKSRRKKAEPAKPKPKRRCVRIDEGVNPDTGKRVRKAFYGKTLKEAREKRDAYLAAQKKGTSLADQNQTVAQWIDIWLDTYVGNVGYSSRCSYESAASKLNASLGHMRMRDVREVDIRTFAASVSHYSKSSVHKIKLTTRQIFRRALANRIIDVDPSLDVAWGHCGEGTHRCLSAHEVSIVCLHWREHTAGLWAMIMLWAGLRRGEAMALSWDDIDLSANYIHVRHGVHYEGNEPVIGLPKTTGSVRDVPILPPLRAAFESTPRRGEYVCCSAKGALVTKSAWASNWRGYLHTMTNIINGDTAQPIAPGRRSDLDVKRRLVPRAEFAIRAHDLRHTYASMLYDAGVDVKTAQKLLGHATPEITMRIYTHLSDARQAVSIEKMVAFSENYISSGHQMGINLPKKPQKQDVPPDS